MGPPNPDIEKERLSSTFDPDHVTSQIYGHEGMHIRRAAYKRVIDDPEFKATEKFSTMPREQVFEEAVRLYASYRVKSRQYGYKDPVDKVEGAQNFFREAVFLGPVFPFGVHHDMFLPTIESQASDELKAEILPKAENLEIIGTYAQTELGHGTYIKNLETTATFDRERQQFIIHSPTLTSMKYWPAGLGCTVNYAVVMANLIIDGREYGLHGFVCQLRDLENHKPLPGVEVGDINQKFGYNVLDNGFLRFNQLRIPRKNMLMRYSQISRDGVYTSRGVPQVAYLVMVMIRAMIVLAAADDLAKAATIATRYSAVRRQTANTKGVEPQILDYQTQQMKVFPAISTAYALFFTGIAIKQLFSEVRVAIDNGDSSRLREMHCISSGLKAFASETAVSLIETCRRSCGGHGYSHASGLPTIYTNCLPQCTYEGENTVMYLQCARSLMRFYMEVQQGKPVPSLLSLLAEFSTTPSNPSAVDVFDLEHCLDLVKHNAACMISGTLKSLHLSIQSMDQDSAWNNHSTQLVEMAKAYMLYICGKHFIDVLRAGGWEPCAKAVMKLVCEFYIVTNILENSGRFLQNSVVSLQQMNCLSTRRIELLEELRPNAVALVDAFDYPDRLLNSCLGRYDGNVYEALYEYAKSSTLNQHQVHPSYHKYVKPMQKKLKSNL